MKHINGEVNLKEWELDAFNKAQDMVKTIIAEATSEAIKHSFEDMRSCVSFQFRKNEDPLDLMLSPELGEYADEWVHYNCNLKDVIDQSLDMHYPTKDKLKSLAQAMRELADYIDSKVEEAPYEDWESEP